MVKRFVMILLACLLLFSSASANQWGAEGWTIDVFDDGPWEDYNVLESSYKRSGDYAQLIASSRYHNELICLAKDSATRNSDVLVLATSTTAVYQPDHPDANKAKLRQTEDGFVLEYPDEWYRFRYHLGSYLLVEAYLGNEDTSVVWREDAPYLFMNSCGRAELDIDQIYLDHFHISLFPRMADVAHLNHLWASLGDGNPFYRQAPSVLKVGNAPVYSAPDKHSWRAAKGRASVSLKATEEYEVLGSVDGWTLIEYKVSQRTSRIGYVPEGYLATEVDPQLLHVPAFVSRDTYITDDPNVSQYPQFDLHPGQPVTLLAYYNHCYAYAEVTLDHTLLRGFIPMTALTLADNPSQNGSVPHLCQDLMADMEGVWTIWAGGDMLPGYYTQFRSDGTFNSYADWDNGRYHTVKGGYWYVTPYEADSGVSWANPPYLFTMQIYDGYTTHLGLSIQKLTREDVEGFGMDYAPGDTTLNFTNEEGGGGYVNILPHLETTGFIEEENRESFGDHG